MIRVSYVKIYASGTVGPTSCFSNTTQEKNSDDTCSLNTVIDCTRFSTLKRLVSVTGYVMRFIGNIRKRLEKRRIRGSVVKMDYRRTTDD